MKGIGRIVHMYAIWLIHPARVLCEAVDDFRQGIEEFGLLIALPDPPRQVGRFSDVHVEEAAKGSNDVGVCGDEAVRGTEHSGMI